MLEKGDGFMTTYMDAVEEFRESATAFIQNLNLLAQAREAYQQAMTASVQKILIMGGYGHSRIREWVFGGFTQQALAEAPLAVLMVH